MKDTQTPQIKERIWVEKFDKTGDTPVLIETILVENGVATRIAPEPSTDEAPDAPR